MYIGRRLELVDLRCFYAIPLLTTVAVFETQVNHNVFGSCKDWSLVKNSMNYLYSLITTGLAPSLLNAEDIFSGKLENPSPMSASYWDSLDVDGSLKTKINVMYVDRLNEQVRQLHNSKDLIESFEEALKGKARVRLKVENES